MADAEADAALRPETQRLAAGLRSRLGQLQAELVERRADGASSAPASSSGVYCREFCQILLQYAGNRGASEHILPFLEVYQVAIQSFASARPYLTTECEDVLLVLGRLVLSCFELLLSVPESEEQSEPLLRLFQSIQDSHNALLEFGDNSVEALADICKEGIWKNPVLLKIISQQPVEAEEVNKLIKREGPTFLQMRIKHLMKTNCLLQAASLAKLCKDSTEISDTSPFLQAYITCLCSMHPNEESFKEIAKVDCKEVLDMICNLEAESQESTAFILCTTYLTQQLQTGNVYCSWELTLCWSKLQRRIDPSLDSFLERCRQFGIIARTLQHLFFLIRVIQAEAEEAGLAVSVLLCVRALQLRSNENDEMKTSVCKTIACLLPEDLEVRRACQLTEYLLDPKEEGYNLLEELYLLPDQKFDEENAPVPNSLRCELLLALKAYWPFDPEFWDWKTLRRHCLKLLGKQVSESEDDLSCNEMSFNETELLDSLLSDCEEGREEGNFEGMNQPKMRVRIKKPIGSSERYQRWLQYKFFCLICKRECIEARILHHSKMHMEGGIFTCPVCIKKFKSKDIFVRHVMEHVKMPPSRKYRAKKKVLIKKEKLTHSRLSRFASPALEENQPLKIMPRENPKINPQDYVTFSKLEDCHLEDRDVYPCPGTDCSRVFKQFKYLSVHLKAEHQNNDENAMHYLDMKNRREKCSYCRRHFMSAVHLQEHEQVHMGPQPYMCVSVGCYARFNSVNELLHHKQQHDDLRYKCELSGCNIVFSDLGQLYHHEAQHFRDASYTCNFHGCKKFYYSKSEFTNHLSMHISNGEMKEMPIKHEDHVSRDNHACLSDSAVVEQKDAPHLSESPSLPPGATNSEGILMVKQEPLSDEEIDGKSNGSVGSNIVSLANENEVALLTETVDCGQAAPSSVLPHEKVFHPSNLKERYSNVAVYFDGKRFTCGFEGCGSIYKNSKVMQKHLRRAHPYHFKPKRKHSLQAKDTGQFNESLHNSSAGEIGSELHNHSDTNADSPGILDCSTSPNNKCYFKDEPWPSSPETSLCEYAKAPSTEDAMLELLLGLKHLSLTNSSGRFGSSSRLLQSYSSKGSNSEDESTSDHFLEEQRGKLPNQYLTQLAAKPFFCEHQGCSCEFVTREALLTHYVRKHNYSKEMVLQLNMFQYRYSPFKCHICQRSFTRKTHLRVHYRNKHKLGNKTATQKLFGNESFEDGDCVEDMLNSSAASMSSFYANTEEELDGQSKLTGSKKEELSSETDLESSEEAESCVSEKQTKLSTLESHRKGLEAREGRGSKRTVAKGNLCYILHKYHKPFHCVHKNCSSAFTNQKGLIRHYRTVHQYNKEQLCLEKDKARTKRELAKCKKIFVCKDKTCSKRFLCPKSLAKHCSDFHALDHREDSKMLSETVRFPCHHPHCPAAFYSFHKLKHHLMEEHSKEEEVNKEIEIHCDLNGCNRVFTTYSRYCQHVYFRHGDYDGVMGDAKEQTCLKDRYLRHDVSEKRRRISEKVEKNNNKNKGKQLYNFRTREEALQMCRDNYNQTQYPCMIHGCPSVVKLESSIVRHYKRTHQMASVYIEQQYEELVLCVECGTVINDPCLEGTQSTNKANHISKQDETLRSAYQHGREECLGLNSDFDHEDKGSKNSRCSVSDKPPEAGVFLCTGTLKHTHSPKSRCFEERNAVESAQQCKTNLGKIHGTCQDRESDEEENNSYCTGSATQFSREKDASDWQPNTSKLPVSAPKDKLQNQPAPKPFDLKSFKPMGFESSFLKFLQESEARDDDDDDDDDDEEEDKGNSEHEWEQTKQPERGVTAEKVKDIKRELSQSRAKCENVSAAVSKKSNGSKAQGQLRGVQPLLSTDSPIPSLENLRAILDKALTNCGDHALKQLHYLRPVVVLERSKFSTSLIDFFPTKKADHLCVGSS
uniref:C2H2-type domain-containing protein n=1 Tax=Anolis carolinensis TaxID=28377 RepID=H9GNR0_ANOCA|nr:PREDICTED: zinc finger protein Rlf [Anolis carolinensis]|eukprot:XP_003225002.1 PREDICTED: zinc finger protein Rlf [Anolis carolinensis]